jgi:hypothetical protein
MKFSRILSSLSQKKHPFMAECEVEKLNALTELLTFN